MAHPVMFNNVELLKELIEAGKIDGIEAYHFSATVQKQKELAELAKKHDLIVTGGSDFHGLYNSTMTHIGKYVTDQENLDKIFKLIHANAQKVKQSAVKAEQ